MRVKLLKHHQDSGVDYQAGDLLEVEEQAARWLISNAIAKKVASEIASEVPGTKTPADKAVKKSLKGE